MWTCLVLLKLISQFVRMCLGFMVSLAVLLRHDPFKPLQNAFGVLQGILQGYPHHSSPELEYALFGVHGTHSSRHMQLPPKVRISTDLFSQMQIHTKNISSFKEEVSIFLLMYKLFTQSQHCDRCNLV